jgi:hypothetical protein
MMLAFERMATATAIDSDRSAKEDIGPMLSAYQ